jgi:hypothetical protein
MSAEKGAGEVVLGVWAKGMSLDGKEGCAMVSFRQGASSMVKASAGPVGRQRGSQGAAGDGSLTIGMVTPLFWSGHATR